MKAVAIPRPPHIGDNLLVPEASYMETLENFTALINNGAEQIGDELGEDRFNAALSSPQIISFAKSISKLSGASYPLRYWAKNCSSLRYEPSDEEIKAFYDKSIILNQMTSESYKIFSDFTARGYEKITNLMGIMMLCADAIVERTLKEIGERQNEIDRANWY